MKETSYGALALIHKNKEWKIFLVKLQSGNHWGFPKGHPEPNEEPLETALRELKEETKLEMDKSLSIEKIEEHYSFEKEGKTIEKTVVYFPILVKGEPTILQPEILEGGFFDLKEALKKVTYPESKKVLEKLIDLL